MHGVWEFFGCLFFYDMSGFSLLQGALWMAGATLADVEMKEYIKDLEPKK